MPQAPMARTSTDATAPTTRRARPPRLVALRRHRETRRLTKKGWLKTARLNRPVPCAATTPPAAAMARRTSTRRRRHETVS